MTIRRPLCYVFEVREGAACAGAIEQPFEAECILVELNRFPYETCLDIRGLYPQHQARVLTLPNHPGESFPLVPLLTLPAGREIEVRLIVSRKSWWARLKGWLFPCVAHVVLRGDALYEVTEGVPVEVEFPKEPREI